MHVRVGDVHLYFDVVGAGLVANGSTMRERPTLVCLHGGPGGDHTELKHYLAPLADVAQLVFLDHRGQGRSDKSTRDRWNLDAWIDDVRGFCEALGIERPILLGHSFGGVVALGVAIRHPELPAKLVVSSSNARFRVDRALEMLQRLGGEEARAVAERFFREPSREHFEAMRIVCMPLYNPTLPDREMVARTLLRPEVAVHFFGSGDFAYDWLGEVGGIRCPTLILAGEEDPITPVADSEDLAAAIPGARLVRFANAGHGVFRDKPAEAVAVLHDFVGAPLA